MAVIKLSQSKKAVQIVLSEDCKAGTVFQVSSKIYEMMLKGSIKGGFVVLSRLGTGTKPDKFPVSPVWGEDLSGTVSDGLSSKAKKVYEQAEKVKVNVGHKPW